MAEEASDRLVNLLLDGDRISEGSEAARKWVSDLLGLELARLPNSGYGGLFVPQAGKGSGIPVRFSQDIDKEADRKVNELISYCWRSCQDGVFDIDMPPPTLFVASLISAWFDRPLGLLWCLVGHNDAQEARLLIRYVSLLVSLIARGSKGARALQFLSEPIWRAEGSSQTTKEAAEFIANACMSTLGCKAGIVWEVDEHHRSPMLRTLAMVGEVADVESVDMPVGTGIAGVSAQDGRARRVDDLLDKSSLAFEGLGIRHEKVVKNARWRSAAVVPLDIGGRIAGVIAMYGERTRAFSEMDLRIVQSFAERLAASYALLDRLQQLEDKEKKIQLEAAAIESGVLAMEIVHDALNSLGIAQAQIGLVRDRSSREPNSLIHTTSKAVSENIDNAFRLLKKVRDGANIVRVQKARHRLAKTVQSVVAEVQSEAKIARVDITWDCPETLKVEYDEFQVSRVIKNIVLNSLYFLQSVRRDRCIKLTVEEMSDNVLIKVWDNGPGIYPSNLPKVWDYFFTTKGSRGMGFGLAIAARIVRDNHGGDIQVKSTWGEFTEITISLPRKGSSTRT